MLQHIGTIMRGVALALINTTRHPVAHRNGSLSFRAKVTNETKIVTPRINSQGAISTYLFQSHLCIRLCHFLGKIHTHKKKIHSSRRGGMIHKLYYLHSSKQKNANNHNGYIIWHILTLSLVFVSNI